MTGTLASQLKQQKPFSSPEQEAVLGLMMAAARIEEPWAALLKREADITTAQYNVLRILRGSHPGRLACSDIASRMISRDPDITRLLDRLEKRGLVRRVRSETDRRVVEVSIAAKGLKLVGDLDPLVERMPSLLLGHLGHARARQLAALLEDVLAGIGPLD